MKKRIIYLLLIIICIYVIVINIDKREIISNNAVVLIKTYQQNHFYKKGNGFIYKIDDYCYILTNYHVIADSESVNIFINDEKIKGHILNYDEYEDLAIIVINRKYCTHKLELESIDSISKNDKITIITSQEKKNGKIINNTRHIKFNYDNHNKMLDLMELQATINKGDSGSPAINKDNKVIGIITMTSNDNHVFAIPINSILNKINSLEDGYIYRVNLGIKATNNMQDLKGVLLEEVYDKELASIVGLKQGDIIVKLNDINIEDVSDFRYYLYKIKRYELFEIGYYRNGIYYTTIIMGI